MMAGLTWLDWALLAVLAMSIVVGVARGFVFECLSLAGWLVAWFGAQWGSPWVSPWVAAVLPSAPTGSALNMGLAFAGLFIVVLIAWSLLARLVRLLLHATPLSLPDRALGAGFGLLRGGVLLMVVATLVALTPASQSQTWQGSQGARWLTSALAGLKPLLPEALARFVHG
jgi:membrane protein required for colicin V production